MNATPTSPSDTAALQALQLLAPLLQRLERSKVAVDAAQYQSVVQRLAAALAAAPAGTELNAMLDAHPALAELYENLQYPHAGLCRAPLDVSLATERNARAAIARAMHASLQG